MKKSIALVCLGLVVSGLFIFEYTEKTAVIAIAASKPGRNDKILPQEDNTTWNNLPSISTHISPAEDDIKIIAAKKHSKLGRHLLKKEQYEHAAKKRLEEWTELIHKAAPGDDWKLIEAQSITHLIKSKNSRDRSQKGTWIERGPTNIPGRITDIDIDYTSGHIYAISDHGVVFKSADLQASNWLPLNDRFPLGLDVATQLEVLGKGKMVTSGYIKSVNQWGVFYSADDGLTWTPSAGLGSNVVLAYRRLLKDGDDVFVFVQEYSAPANSDFYKIYKSSDQGASFQQLYSSTIPVGDGWRHVRSDMWISNNINNPNLYLVLEDSFFIVDKTSGMRTFNGLIANTQINNHLLTGIEVNGVVYLNAFTAQGDPGKFYSWNSTTNTWKFEGQLTDWWLSMPFGSNSFSCSKVNPNELYFGSILTSKSYDGGQNWITMGLDSTKSYALYHGDVPKTMTIINSQTNQEEMYMGTDGGVYKLDYPTQHFEQLSIPGLNCTQIYKMVSKQSAPGTMYIGTQDNGYSHTTNGIIQPGTVDFTFQWGGDVTNVASGDGGNTFWLWWLGDGCNYQNGPDETNTISNWSPYEVDGSIPYWEAPVWIPNHFPDRCYTAGVINNNSGNYIIKLTAQPGKICKSEQLPFDFYQATGSNISAIAISPMDSNYFYVTTGSGHFFTSTDGGNTWSYTLISNSMYPRAILPSKLNPGEVWVVGSGYSNSPVYHSLDHGSSFQSLNQGLPACLGEAITANSDESALYLATSIGPFVYFTKGTEWQDLSDNMAPLVHYMSVEFIQNINTVRFATYARGVWDFAISDVTNTLESSAESDAILIYPTPTSGDFTIRFDAFQPENDYSVSIINNQGQIVYFSTLSDKVTPVHASDRAAKGVYYVVIHNKTNNQKEVRKLVVAN